MPGSAPPAACRRGRAGAVVGGAVVGVGTHSGMVTSAAGARPNCRSKPGGRDAAKPGASPALPRRSTSHGGSAEKGAGQPGVRAQGRASVLAPRAPSLSAAGVRGKTPANPAPGQNRARLPAPLAVGPRSPRRRSWTPQPARAPGAMVPRGPWYPGCTETRTPAALLLIFRLAVSPNMPGPLVNEDDDRAGPKNFRIKERRRIRRPRGSIDSGGGCVIPSPAELPLPRLSQIPSSAPRPLPYSSNGAPV